MAASLEVSNIAATPAASTSTQNSSSLGLCGCRQFARTPFFRRISVAAILTVLSGRIRQEEK
jgi:hypothetical protein